MFQWVLVPVIGDPCCGVVPRKGVPSFGEEMDGEKDPVIICLLKAS